MSVEGGGGGFDSLGLIGAGGGGRVVIFEVLGSITPPFSSYPSLNGRRMLASWLFELVTFFSRLILKWKFDVDIVNWARNVHHRSGKKLSTVKVIDLNIAQNQFTHLVSV